MSSEIDYGLDEEQKYWIRKNIQQLLGSVDAVNKFYHRDSSVDKYARRVALEIYPHNNNLHIEHPIPISEDKNTLVGKQRANKYSDSKKCFDVKKKEIKKNYYRREKEHETETKYKSESFSTDIITSLELQKGDHVKHKKYGKGVTLNLFDNGKVANVKFNSTTEYVDVKNLFCERLNLAKRKLIKREKQRTDAENKQLNGKKKINNNPSLGGFYTHYHHASLLNDFSPHMRPRKTRRLK